MIMHYMLITTSAAFQKMLLSFYNLRDYVKDSAFIQDAWMTKLGGMDSCALPLTTNVTISTSISQNFRSWVAISHLRQPMVCLSHSSYGFPGLAPRRNVLFWEWHDFHVSFSSRDLPGNVCNRPSGISMVDMGISSKIYEFLLLWNVTWHSGTWSYTVTPSIDQTFH